MVNGENYEQNQCYKVCAPIGGRLCIPNRDRKQCTYILSESQAALKALASYHIVSKLVWTQQNQLGVGAKA